MPTSVIFALGAGFSGSFAAGTLVFSWGAFATALVVGSATKMPARIE